jgi:DNA-directed RNA polymerase specialized sigma24 family protein
MVNKSKDYISRIEKGGREREEAIFELYEHTTLKSSVYALIQKEGGSNEDAEDIWQDAIVVFDANIRNGKFRQEGSIEGYLYGIARMLWKNKVKKSKKIGYLEGVELTQIPDMIAPEPDVRLEKLNFAILQMQKKCVRILTMLLEAHSMEHIAKQMGYKSKDVAKKEASICRKKLKAMIQQLCAG